MADSKADHVGEDIRNVNADPLAKETAVDVDAQDSSKDSSQVRRASNLDDILKHKSFWQAALPVFACGAGLFSDGYINNVIGSVNVVLKQQYKEVYTKSAASKYVSDIAFAGTVVGQLVFGFLSDHWSRTNSLVVSTLMLIVFTALATGSYFKGEPVGMFNMLTAWRFFVGIGIGGMSTRNYSLRALPAPVSSVKLSVLTHLRRVSGWQCWMRRVQWRAQKGHAQPMVHSLYQHHD